MQNPDLTATAAQLASLVSLSARLNAADPASHALILSDAVRRAGGTSDMPAEDYPAIYEFSLHGVLGAGFDRDSAAENWLLAADGALSGGVPSWAAKIVRCPVPGIPVENLNWAARTVLATMTDKDARHAAHLIIDAADAGLFAEQAA